MNKPHRISFPRNESKNAGQDEVYFFLIENERPRKIRFHDYEAIYDIPGLYEQVFYERLKCQSPAQVTRILASAVTQSNERLSELRVLDIGAGNGMMAEVLGERGFSRMIGVDIIESARRAVERDRPGLYDSYYITDLRDLDDEMREEIRSWNCDCMTTVAALGFGDIPPPAFIEAFNLISDSGWVAFNIKETFLDDSDVSGFSLLIRKLIFSRYLKLYHLERYRHRLSIDGAPLYYYAIAARKCGDIPPGFFDIDERE